MDVYISCADRTLEPPVAHTDNRFIMAPHRACGILLHVTSLPGRFGIGDLGPHAYAFADLLERVEAKLWQVLPLVPVGHGYSPYSSPSTFAGNPLLISPELLINEGLLRRDELNNLPAFPEDRVDFEEVVPFKMRLLESAYERFLSASDEARSSFRSYCKKEAAWLDDYATFMAIREQHDDMPWTDWPAPLRDREDAAMQAVRRDLEHVIGMHRFWQFVFDVQWRQLRAYCNERGISIVGDIPIYVAHDSADVWANPELFQLDDHGQPTVVAGVPPDYFSETGQRWGNPIYRWDRMKHNGYAWWERRLTSALNQVDVVRLDHFRGFEAYWEVPATEPTAINGRWVRGPGSDLFDTLRKRLGELPVIAEDLGLITKGVVELMERYDFPGMAVLQFAFDSDAEDKFLPHNYRRNLVAYSGTHDNDTLHGWFANNSSTQDESQVRRARQHCRKYLGIRDGDEDNIHWYFIRALQMSVADTIIVPLQDVLGLGPEARMNVPGQAVGNWSWRYPEGSIPEETIRSLREMTRLYGRGRATDKQTLT